MLAELDLGLLARPGLIPFALPLALWVLVSAFVARRRLRGPLFLVVTALRIGLALVLLWFAAGPERAIELDPPARLEIHVDGSLSIGAAARTRLLAQASEKIAAGAAQEPSLRVDLFAFAGQARLVWSGRAAEFAAGREALDAIDLAELDPLSSRLDRSILLGAAHRREGERLGRLVLTDGALPPPTTADPAGLTFIVPPSAAAERNLRLLDLGLPARVETGRRIDAVLSYVATLAGKVPVTVSIDGRSLMTFDLEHGVGPGELTFSLDDVALDPGLHRVDVQAQADDDEPADDQAARLIEVTPRLRPLLVANDLGGAARPAFLRALEAQDVDVRSKEPGDLLAADLAADCDLLVLDRVAPAELSTEALAAIEAFVLQGGGLIVLPRDQADELLAWNESSLAAFLPMTGLPEPRIPPDDKPDRPEDDDPAKKLSDPDPDKKTEKEVDAPTLVMLIVIDASASMKEGARIVYAIRGAIATLRKLHPEDRIGVIAYNDRPTEVVPVQEAGNVAEIERAIARIEPDGATDIEAALAFARTTLEREQAAVKTIILLSDGYTRPFNVKEVARGLLAAGISVTTVGVGSQFDTPMLTQIAKYSGGTGPIPARNARQLPAVMVDVAARLIDRNGLRKAPEKKPELEEDEIVRPEVRIEPGHEEPAPSASGGGEDELRLDLEVERPASFLDGIEVESAPPIAGMHRSEKKRGASISLRVADHGPALAFWRRGDGLVAMTALPLEGSWAAKFSLWDSYSPLAAQLYHFAARDPSARAVEFSAEQIGDQALVEIFDERRRDAPSGWLFRHGARILKALDLGEGRYRVDLPEELRPPLVQLDAIDPDDGSSHAIGLVLSPPAEILDRGVDLPGLAAWAEALGGRIQPELGDSLLPARRVSRERRARVFDLGLALAAIFLLELALKRRLASRSSFES